MSSKLKELDAAIASKLSALALNATDAERAFMQEIAARQREPNGFETDIDAFPETPDQSEAAKKKAAIDFFQKLESIGCGEVLFGRRKYKTRIRWHPYGAIAVANAFLREFEKSSELVTTDDMQSKQLTPTNSELHQHSFLLRHSLKVFIDLPLDLTKEEANRLADFIRSIPF